METKHYLKSAEYAFGATLAIIALLFASFWSFEPKVGKAQVDSEFTIKQTILSEVSFLVDANDVNLANISGITGGESNGTTTAVVLTNNGSGYNMTISFFDNGFGHAMLGDTTYSSLYNYPAASPTFGFNTATTAALFGYTVSDGGSGDVAAPFLSTGSVCGSGGGNFGCWMEPQFAPYTIVNSSGATDPTGATTTIAFKVFVPNNPDPVVASDTYTATATLTATVNPQVLWQSYPMTTYRILRNFLQKNSLEVLFFLAFILNLASLAIAPVALAEEGGVDSGATDAAPLSTTVASPEAQDQDATDESTTGDVEGDLLATSTEDDANATVPEDDWFKIEKLVGGPNAIGDFVIGPGILDFGEVEPGKTVTANILVSNRIADNKTFEINVEDMTSSSDSSGAVTLLGDEVGPYTIKDYVSFPSRTFTIDLGERAVIPISITLPQDAEPGGFYGSVLISTVQTDEDSNSSVRSPVIARIGTLLFVRVKGDVEQSGGTKSLTLPNNKHWYEKGPIKFSVLYENTGNVHSTPSGELRIKNLFGEEVGFEELDPWFVLPHSLRNRDIEWNRELLFGRYTATAAIDNGYNGTIEEVTVSFWVLPWKVVGGIFLVIFIVLFLIRTFFRTFEFKRKK